MEKTTRQELKQARQKLANELDEFVKASRSLLEPLKELNETQIAAIVTLGYSMRVIFLAGRPTANLSQEILTDFKEVIDETCPPLGKVSLAKDPCLEATISYVAALAKCEAEDPPRSEEECFEAWGAGAEAVMCTMKELEEMKERLADIFGRLRPPRPIPWPK
ncbi:MAG: hypothetical protein ACFFFG_08075 [Candidatus Thorarchaeota archaeon]